MGKATLKFYQIGQGDKTISICDFMGVKYSQMFIQIKTLRGLEIIARWGPLPISMVLRITETSPYSFGNFRKLSLYNCFMPI